MTITTLCITAYLTWSFIQLHNRIDRIKAQLDDLQKHLLSTFPAPEPETVNEVDDSARRVPGGAVEISKPIKP